MIGICGPVLASPLSSPPAEVSGFVGETKATTVSLIAWMNEGMISVVCLGAARSFKGYQRSFDLHCTAPWDALTSKQKADIQYTCMNTSPLFAVGTILFVTLRFSVP